MLFETGKWKSSIEGLVFNSQSPANSVALEFPFSEEEVFSALSSLGEDKAPSLNGFTLAFWQVMDKMGFGSKWLYWIRWCISMGWRSFLACFLGQRMVALLRGSRFKERHETGVEACLGLKINLKKSELILVGDVPNFEEFAEVLGWKVGTLPTTYLYSSNHLLRPPLGCSLQV
ncbi:hypothetical protein CK203_023716 [Vitis vinifera]|uniref:Uncharacterized protein n=1 Tax=Vitis vinifera TaxID=29760 RepID=A0A438JBS9_VITVI|nr:hypothetical protein CK203_023716 [Vitis vinifera]